MKTTRNTQQKKIILNALMCADHPTASELYEEIAVKYPTISRATVFRVLSQFSERGLINKLSLADSSARFDACTKPHAHLHCMNCGKVFDLHDKQLDDILNKKNIGGFEIYSSNIEFAGICNDCKNNKIN